MAQPDKLLVEHVAIALCPWMSGKKYKASPEQIWVLADERTKKAYRAQAKAAIEAMQSYKHSGDDELKRPLINLPSRCVHGFQIGGGNGQCPRCAEMLNLRTKTRVKFQDGVIEECTEEQAEILIKHHGAMRI